MQAPPEIITALNKMLYNELTAINQYFLHARMMRHWGFKALGEKIYEESIGGLPNMQDLGKLHIGENVVEALNADLTLEVVARNDTAEAITLFERERDYVSREITTKILVDSEEHIDYLETQLGLVELMGVPNYLQSAAGEIGDDT
jgi:bacterioferritin